MVPCWGLAFTNSYRLADPLSRPLAIEFENGNRANVVERFADTPIPRVAESSDRHGRPIERLVMRPNAGTEAGLPYDQVTRYKLSPWGDAGLAEEKAVVRGTEVALFQETPEARVYFDLTKPYEASRWAVDPRGHFGLPAVVAGVARSNVTAVFRSQLREWRNLGATNRPVEHVVELE